MGEDLRIDVYRVGWWTHRWWPRAWMLRQLITGRAPSGHRIQRSYTVQAHLMRSLRLIRRPHRPWQAEHNRDCLWARRAWTQAGAYKKIRFDAEWQALTGQPSPWVRRRLIRKGRKALRTTGAAR